MDQTLRDLFERALADEPVPPPGDLAGAAMAQGTRLRRRRHLIGGTATALALAVATAGAVQIGSPAGVPAAGPAPVPSATCPAGPGEVSIFLREDVTDAQRQAVHLAVTSSVLVRDSRYETREQAFEKFKVLWRDDPEFTKSVHPDQLPESFRVGLKDPATASVFQAGLRSLDGIQDIVVGAC